MLPWMDSNGRLWGKWNVLDAGVALLLAVLLLGVLFVQLGWHRTSAAQVLGESDILIQLYLRSRTNGQPLFVKGETTNITVRNQPRGEVTIVDVQQHDPKVTLMGANGQPTTVTDGSIPGVYDTIITLKDHAVVSKEGFVCDGVKMKIGLPIELEGQSYRLTGQIIRVAKEGETADFGLTPNPLDGEKTNALPKVDPSEVPQTPAPSTQH